MGRLSLLALIFVVGAAAAADEEVQVADIAAKEDVESTWKGGGGGYGGSNGGGGYGASNQGAQKWSGGDNGGKWGGQQEAGKWGSGGSGGNTWNGNEGGNSWSAPGGVSKKLWDTLRPNRKYDLPDRPLEIDVPPMTPCSPVPGGPNTQCGRQTLAQTFTLYCMQQSSEVAVTIRAYCSQFGPTPNEGQGNLWNYLGGANQWNGGSNHGGGSQQWKHGNKGWASRGPVSWGGSNWKVQARDRIGSSKALKCENAYFSHLVSWTVACLAESWTRIKYIQAYAKFSKRQPYLWQNRMTADILKTYNCNKTKCFRGYCNPMTESWGDFPFKSAFAPIENSNTDQVFSFKNLASRWRLQKDGRSVGASGVEPLFEESLHDSSDDLPNLVGPGAANKDRWFLWGYGLFSFCMLQTCEKCLSKPADASLEKPMIECPNHSIDNEFLLKYLAARKCVVKLAEKEKTLINLKRIPIPGYFAGTAKANDKLLSTLVKDGCFGCEEQTCGDEDITTEKAKVSIVTQIKVKTAIETAKYCSKVQKLKEQVDRVCEEAKAKGVCDCSKMEVDIWAKNMNSKPRDWESPSRWDWKEWKPPQKPKDPKPQKGYQAPAPGGYHNPSQPMGYKASAPAPSGQYKSPAPAMGYKAPAPAPGGHYNAPAPAMGYKAPAPAMGYKAPAPAPGGHYNAPPPAMGYKAPAPAMGYKAPAPAPGGHYNAPAPAMGYKAPAPAPVEQYSGGAPSNNYGQGPSYGNHPNSGSKGFGAVRHYEEA